MATLDPKISNKEMVEIIKELLTDLDFEKVDRVRVNSENLSGKRYLTIGIVSDTNGDNAEVTFETTKED